MATLYANPTVLNSLTSPTSTSIRANVTTANDVNFATNIFYYRVVGATTWTSAGEGVPTSNTTDDFDITGLTTGKVYELYCVAVDTSDLQSVPSAVYTVLAGTIQSEGETFLDNLKEIISQSSTFQTWTGTANSTDAKAYIYKRYFDNPTGKYALIDLEDNNSESTDNTNKFSIAEMSFLLVEEVTTNYETRDSQAELSAFAVTSEKIRDEILILESLNGNLVIPFMSTPQKHDFGDREDSTEVMAVNYNIRTGV